MTKKLLFSLTILISSVLFVSCTANSPTNNETTVEEEPDSEDVKEELNSIEEENSSEDELEKSVEYEGKIFERVYNLENNKEIYYALNEPILIISDGEYQLLNTLPEDDFPSCPQLSPNKENIVYIAPFEFELDGNVYIYNLEEEKLDILIQVQDENGTTAKVVTWLDDNRLLVIIGSSNGTITKGGDLFMFDIDTGDLELIKNVDLPQEITDVKIINDEVVIDIIEWDDTFQSFTTEEMVLDIQ